MNLADSLPRSPANPPRSQPDKADTASYRERSPPPADTFEHARTRDMGTPHDDVRSNGEPSQQPPSGPSSYRNGNYERPPPTGPSRSFSQPSQQSPPTGPSASNMPMSAHNRGGGGGGSTLGAPTRPRGAPGAPGGRFESTSREFTSPPMRGRGSLTYRGPAPFGPRGGGYGRGEFGASRGDFGGGRGDFGPGSYRGGFGRGSEQTFPFRGNNSSSTTYPRTQRFNTIQQHLTTTEKIVPGGKLLPSSLPPEQERRIKALEAEAERMRSEIAEKQRTKREVLNEWEVRERESEREGLRSELAEAHLQALMESEDGVGRAAF